jgi:hypothetical protein
MLLFKGFLTLCLADIEKGVKKGSKTYIEIKKGGRMTAIFR